MAAFKCVKDLRLGVRGCADCNNGKGCIVVLARIQSSPGHCIFDHARAVEWKEV